MNKQLAKASHIFEKFIGAKTSIVFLSSKNILYDSHVCWIHPKIFFMVLYWLNTVKDASVVKVMLQQTQNMTFYIWNDLMKTIFQNEQMLIQHYKNQTKSSEQWFQVIDKSLDYMLYWIEHNAEHKECFFTSYSFP